MSENESGEESEEETKVSTLQSIADVEGLHVFLFYSVFAFIFLRVFFFSFLGFYSLPLSI